MVKSRWVGLKGQSNLISSALRQSIHMPGHLAHVKQRTYAPGQLKDFAEMELACDTWEDEPNNATHISMLVCVCVGAVNMTSCCSEYRLKLRQGSEVRSCLSCLSSPINYNY